MKISITNLNRTASAKNLKELFAPFGDVRSATLLLDRSTGRSRGVGQIEMPEPSSGRCAIAALNNTSFMSQSIYVREVTEEALAAFSTHF